MKTTLKIIVAAIILAAFNLSAATRYVDVNSATPTAPYTTWATAARVIQDAVDAAVAGDTVLVTDGTYKLGGRTVGPGLLLNRVAVKQGVRVQSVNGPAVTIIEGAPAPGGGTGEGAVRCASVDTNAVLSGFTLTNGHTRTSTADVMDYRGGGVLCYYAATVTNCLVTGNHAVVGGGSFGGKLYSCRITGNSAQQDGGGGIFGLFINCVISSNSAQLSGGGAAQAAMRNCTVTGNSAGVGGGLSGSSVTNCIVYFNSASQGANYDSSALNYCCSTPLPAYGAGNMTGDPAFMNPSSGNFRLQPTSPCIDAGDRMFILVTTDLDGLLRPQDGNGDGIAVVDMGAYEYAYSGAPFMVEQPASQTAYVGATVMFQATALGKTPLHYQWQRYGVPVASATNAILSFSAVKTQDAGGYRVVVTNAVGSVTSQVAVLTVKDAAPLIIRQPSSKTVFAGTNVTFTVAAEGTLPLSWQWRHNGADIFGATNQALNLSAVTTNHAGNYVALVTNAVGSQFSQVAVLTVLDVPPHILVQPVNQQVFVGSNVTFTVAAEGTLPLFCQWRLNGTNILGATNWSLTLSAVTTNQAGFYTAMISNPRGSLASDAAQLVVLLPGTRYVWQDSPSPAPPYMTWATAARVIQDAVDAAWPGEKVLVTNGIYNTGGRTGGTTLLVNRVVIEKAIRLESVNGPAVTIIEGSPASQGDEHGNGDSAVRCVYLGKTNAIVTGFTLTKGHTRTAGHEYSEQSGGGVYWSGAGPSDTSFSAVVSNCVITANSAHEGGGGSFGGTLYNCTLVANRGYYGGGASGWGTLRNCILSGNSGRQGGGAGWAVLYNCTLTGNSAEEGGGVYYCFAYNSIVCLNTSSRSRGEANYSGGAGFEYSCTTPLPEGSGNIDTDPQFITASHLSANSPCRGKGGSQYASGVDIDGEPWANPPSMGADELVSGNATGFLSLSITANYTNVAPGYPVLFTAHNSGAITRSVWDFGDGIVLTNKPFTSHAWTTPGNYTVRLTGYNDSHPEGVSTALLVEIVAAVHYVNAANPTPVPPYTSWQTAATNIQAAIDAGTTVGRLVLVTNGVYRTGMVEGKGTNRVVLTGPLVLRSVNGPRHTVIDGGAQVRCAYVGREALLSGFTLTNGSAAGDWPQNFGGGVYADGFGVVSNCLITGNSVVSYGGGASGGTLYNCTLISNSAGDGGGAYASTLYNCTLSGNSSGGGGGASGSTLYNCTLTRNSAFYGGGASYCTLNNCTLTGNSARRDPWGSGGSGGGADGSTLYNCIVYYNTSASGIGPNYSSSTLNYCCTTPLPVPETWQEPFVGNITAEPQLASASHLSASSPCRGAGNIAYATGTDIDGEAWANPPSIGCDEYDAGPVTGPLSVAIVTAYTNVAAGHPVDFTGLIEGRATASVWDFGGGVVLSNRPYATHAWTTLGNHTVVLEAYNESHPTGVSATVTVQVVSQQVHFVATNSANPVSPYTSWATAATTIQDAVEAATQIGALVLVSNGVYAAGGMAVVGTETNRVAVTKPLMVRSVNGPLVTVINGGNFVTNEFGEVWEERVRCVWLGSHAILSGFTLTNASTGQGGGVFCENSGAVTNCVITGNSAWSGGGGAYGGTLNNCTLTGNSAYEGGGAYGSTLYNCTLLGNKASGWEGDYGGGTYGCTLSNCILSANSARNGGGAHSSTLNGCILTGNSAWNGGGACESTLNNCILSGNSAAYGGGAYGGTLNNCTLTRNSAPADADGHNGYGGGVYGATLKNCIVYFNTATNGANYFAGLNEWGEEVVTLLDYSCTTPLPTNGVGNIAADPQLASTSHLSVFSPCRGAGSAAYSTGTDIDGEPWRTPPSMGCDEYHAGLVTGPLSANIIAGYTNVAAGFPVNFTALIEGQTSLSIWDFGDGTLSLNQPYETHAWAAPGDYAVTLWAFNDSHPDGVSFALTIQVVQGLHFVAANSANPVSPYISWATAATNIQDAVDAAPVGGTVLVTNGTYAFGGRAAGTNVSVNRVTVDKILMVRSVNGPEVTVIRGYQVPGVTNGDGAIRCAYLANGAALSGFTLTNGATRTSSEASDDREISGGGVWCESTSSVVSNCVITGNSAASGGGARGGTLFDCTLIGNSTTPWGDGGGVLASVLYNCTLQTNRSSENGGGAARSTLYSCTLTGNTASNVGGGAVDGVASGCVFRGNSARNGGGTFGGTLNNCTLIGNSASEQGGGIFSGSAWNSIICENLSPKGPNFSNEAWIDYAWIQYCCTSPLPTNGIGNINADPLFLNRSAGNLHLQFDSPCINAGNNAYVHGSTDLDGNPRIISGIVDIGAYEFQLEPVIVVQPLSQTSFSGKTVTLQVTAQGAAPLSYQWQFSGTNISGATNSVLVLTNIQARDAGNYTVVVSNAFGAATSHGATLTVTDSPTVIVAQPTDQTTYSGTTASFQVTADGSWPLMYQWQFEGSPIAGATNSVLILQDVAVNQGGNYSVVVSNALGATVSRDTKLTVLTSLPLILVQPTNQITWPGGSATFQVAADGSRPLSYQWRFEGAPILDATNALLTLNPVTFGQEGIYSVAVRNSVGTVVSANAVLWIPPVVAWGSKTNVPTWLANVVAIAAGSDHDLALRSDGTVVGWSDNPNAASSVPPGLTGVVAIAAGGSHSLALKGDGRVVAWGDNYSGRTNVPSGLTDVVAIAAGWGHSLALKADGTVVAWGDNYSGQASVPAGLTDVVAVAAGLSNSLALKSDGRVVGWGEAAPGQASVLARLTNAVAIAVGMTPCLALKADGTVVAWGINNFGQTNVPAGLSNVVGIAAGFYHSLALRSDGTVVAWGNNSGGQTAVPALLTSTVAVAAGGSQSLALIGRTPSVLKAPLADPTWNANGFSVSLPTQSGRVYRLEYKNSLADAAWSPLALLPGTGGVRVLTDLKPTSAQRFYRVRQW